MLANACTRSVAGFVVGIGIRQYFYAALTTVAVIGLSVSAIGMNIQQ